MGTLGTSDIFLFGHLRLDRRGLFRREEEGGLVPLKIGSRAEEILRVLVERAGELVSKEEIISKVWPETIVEESNLTVQISTLRRFLDEPSTEGGYIQTVPGRGYRFAAPVSRSEYRGAAAPPLTLPDKPSIAVLPFTAMSGHIDQDYLVDGIVDDLITNLSRLRWLFVIARNSTFTYKGRAVEIRQVG